MFTNLKASGRKIAYVLIMLVFMSLTACTELGTTKEVAIFVESLPTKIEYKVGETLDVTGLVVKAAISDGTTTILQEGNEEGKYSISGFSSTTEGLKIVTISYKDFTAKFTVMVKATSIPISKVDGIIIAQMPNKTIYELVEEFSSEGIKVIAIREDGSTSEVNVSSYQITGFDSTSAGVKLVTITYETFTTSLQVTVLPASLTSIKVEELPAKLDYYIGDSLDTTGLVVKAYYSDSSEVILPYGNGETGYEIAEFDNTSVGVKTVTINFRNRSDSFEVNVAKLYHTVSFNNTGTIRFEQNEHNKLLTEPTRPRREGYHFIGWFIQQDDYMWDFAHDVVTKNMELTAKWVKLSATNVVVDAYLLEEERTQYTFKTLQELKEFNLANNSTVNFTPGVYWTDDYLDPHNANTPEHPGLVGITFAQSGLTFKGLTSNADDVRIAGNRGQTLGAAGNWNVIAIGTNFTAYNLTIANYCSVDLVYPRDPSQNVARRGDARVQAQTITSAGGTLDKMYFENVRFVSFLNLIAIGPTRAYYRNCYFQLTDDAIAGGGINVYENCTFDFYGSHPSYGGSTVMAAFLKCTFNFFNGSSEFYFAKSGGNWTLIDNVFKGPKETIYWENVQRADVKHYVYGNVYEDGTPVRFAPEYPDATFYLDDETVRIFKSDSGYNVYNLLKGTDGWDPTIGSTNEGFKFSLSASPSTVESSNASNEIVITPSFYPSNFFTFADLRFEYSEDLFELIPTTDNKLHLRAKLNQQGVVIQGKVIATAPNGLKAQVTINIRPEIVPSPVLQGEANILVVDGVAKLNYVYDHLNYNDHSDIKWYRGDTKGAKDLLVGVTTLNNPFKNYELSRGDIGKYLTAVITPKYEFSPYGTEIITVEMDRVIVETDITDINTISTNFANIVWTGRSLSDKDVWYADTIKPSDVTQAWTPSTNNPWTYVMGDNGGAMNVPGLRTSTQGARLLYQPSGEYTDIILNLDFTPEKSAGQGFGSATDQYLEVYIKWDPVTKTGYALRFQRLATDPLNNNQPIPSSGNSVRVSVIEYVNGIKNILPGSYYESSCYMPDSHLEFKLVDNVISVRVTTNSPQSETQAKYELPHTYEYTYTLPEPSTNLSGAFGFQFTGTVSAGNRTLLENLEVILKPAVPTE
jgi:hypothetical protein